MMSEITDPTAVSAVATDAIVVAPAPATSWFADWANQQGIQEFARLIEQAELTSFIESCETPLTIFVPTNEAIRAMAGTLPTEIQLLRELLCVHITMGSLRWASDRGSYLSGGAYPRPHPFSPHTPSLPPLARRSREELHTNRSITTIGQMTTSIVPAETHYATYVITVSGSIYRLGEKLPGVGQTNTRNADAQLLIPAALPAASAQPRTSGRAKCAPLEFWKGERPIYAASPTGLTLQGVIRYTCSDEAALP